MTNVHVLIVQVTRSGYFRQKLSNCSLHIQRCSKLVACEKTVHACAIVSRTKNCVGQVIIEQFLTVICFR